MKLVAYTLVDKTTGEQWKHRKRLVYDTIPGLRMGYESGRWLPDGGWRTPIPHWPGPFEVKELTYESP